VRPARVEIAASTPDVLRFRRGPPGRTVPSETQDMGAQWALYDDKTTARATTVLNFRTILAAWGFRSISACSGTSSPG
jgi:hypothetical protein